jgi:hypothetical protein
LKRPQLRKQPPRLTSVRLTLLDFFENGGSHWRERTKEMHSVTDQPGAV